MSKTKCKSMMIGLTDLDAEAEHFKKAWKIAAKGGVATAPRYHLGFSSLPEMLKALTPKRWELLETLKRQEPLSIRALSTCLGRDYKNVHADVQALLEFGLVEKGENGLFIPFELVRAELNLAA